MRTSEHLGRILGTLEREVMLVLWSKPGCRTVREVVEELARKREIAYTTVLTIMNRLIEKGLLIRRENKQPHLYEVRYSEAEFFSRVAGKVLGRIRRDFGEVAIACFLDEADRVDRNKLKKLLRKLQKSER